MDSSVWKEPARNMAPAMLSRFSKQVARSIFPVAGIRMEKLSDVELRNRLSASRRNPTAKCVSSSERCTRAPWLDKFQNIFKAIQGIVDHGIGIGKPGIDAASCESDDSARAECGAHFLH